MNKVRITAMRKTVYPGLMEKFERSAQRDALLAKNPIGHTCYVAEGHQWIAIDGKQSEGIVPFACRA